MYKMGEKGRGSKGRLSGEGRKEGELKRN